MSADERIVNTQTAKESNPTNVLNQFTGIFGQPSEIVNKVVNVVSDMIPPDQPVSKVVEKGLSSLQDIMAGVNMPSSLDDVINLPAFSTLKEKFSFLDSVDIFEISQDRFNEIIEGGAE